MPCSNLSRIQKCNPHDTDIHAAVEHSDSSWRLRCRGSHWRIRCARMTFEATKIRKKYSCIFWNVWGEGFGLKESFEPIWSETMTQCRTRVRIYRPKNETKMAKHASISTATPILSQEFSLGVGSLQCSLQTLTGGVRAWTITSSFPMVAVKHGATVISVNIGRSVITHAHLHSISCWSSWLNDYYVHAHQPRHNCCICGGGKDNGGIWLLTPRHDSQSSSHWLRKIHKHVRLTRRAPMEQWPVRHAHFRTASNCEPGACGGSHKRVAPTDAASEELAFHVQG